MRKLFNFTQAKGKWHKFLSFNLGRGAKLYKNFAQKLLAVSLCAAMVLMGAPLGGQGVHVAAAADSAILNTMFLTKADLLKLCEETNSGTGLLATGTDSDVTLRIYFGQRPEAATYFKDSSSTTGTAAVGPTTWLVAGSEKFTPADGNTTDGLVLYSEEPLVSAFSKRGDSKMNSKFQPTRTDHLGGKYWVGSGTDKTDRGDSDWGTYADADPDGTPANPTNVYANHWGASNLRQVLTAIYNGTKLTVDGEEADYSGFFNATEKGLMAASEIRTNDHQTGSAVEYTTEDYLYAPRLDSSSYSYHTNTSVTVGGADSLTIDTAHWGGRSWLRSPSKSSSGHALVAFPGDFVDRLDVTYRNPAISAAFRLDLSSVLFTSAASAASSADGGKFAAISADTPMTLRVHTYLPDFTGTATLSTDKKSITVKNAAEGDVLMVQGVTEAGENWSYSKTIDSSGSTTVTASGVVTACGAAITSFTLRDFSKCNIWLERTSGEEGCTVTYASTPIVAGTTDPATWGSAVTRGDIPHWVASDGTTSVQVPAGNGIIWLKEDSDGTSAWYGLDNSAGVFAEGSRFWVRWLSKQSDPTLWQYYYDKFDTEHKTDVESDNLWIFLIGVTAPDGTEYTDFGTEVPLYIQKGPDWDGNDIRSVFISGASDEVLLSHFHGKMDYPESALHPDAEFYKIMLSHFSPYAIYDALTDEEKATIGLPSTGDISTALLISGLTIVLVSSLGILLRLITNKKQFEE